MGGINIRELFELEIEVFDQLSWSCYTTQTELESVCSLMWQSSTQQSQKCEETGAGSQTPDAKLPLGSPDSLKIGMLVISPGRDNQPDLSPTPAMSDAGSESSGVPSSLDDVRNPIGNETLPSKLNPQKLAFRTPSLSPIPLR